MRGTRARETIDDTAFPAARVPAAAALPASAAFSAAPTGAVARLVDAAGRFAFAAGFPAARPDERVRLFDLLAPPLRDLPLLDAFALLRPEACLERLDLDAVLRVEVELRPLPLARDFVLPRDREEPPPFDVPADRAMSLASVHRCSNAYPGAPGVNAEHGPDEAIECKIPGC